MLLPRRFLFNFRASSVFSLAARNPPRLCTQGGAGYCPTSLDPPGWPCARNPGDPVPFKKLDSLLILIHENINIFITRPQLYIYYKCHRITRYAFRDKTCGQWSKMVFRNAGFSMNLQNNKLVRLHLPRHVTNDIKNPLLFWNTYT